MTTNEIVKLAVKVMEDKKGTEIKVIDISKVSVIADYFILVSGSSQRDACFMGSFLQTSIRLNRQGHAAVYCQFGRTQGGCIAFRTA